MKIRKPWSWVVSAVVAITMPIWVFPVVFLFALWRAVEAFHKEFFED